VELRTAPRRELTIDLDRENLAAIGRTTVREYAARMGVGEAAAKNRLRRLHEAGGCRRHRVTSGKPGMPAWVYLA
jgi:predicted transcriptional regulator